MGIHAGLLDFAQTPIAPSVREELGRMLTSILPGSVTVYEQCGLAMIGHNSPMTLDVLGDNSLEVPPTGHHVVAWDGRLDNRDDLILRLALDGPSSHACDSAIALAAYQKWGADSFGMLVGDWSVALWDDVERVLYLGCDYMGVRPLYYSADARSIAWSSVLRPLALLRHRQHELSTDYVAGLLLTNTPWCLTPFEGVQAVPASHVVRVRGDGSRSVMPHWSPSLSTIRFGRQSAYEDALRTAFLEGVRCRLRTRTSVWAELSGGIDSSSVVCAANALVSRGMVEALGIRCVSEVSDDSLGGDESRYVCAVEEQVGPTYRIATKDHLDTTLPARNWGQPEDLIGPRAAGMLVAAANGGTTLLSGRVGDTVMWNTYEPVEVLLEHLGRGAALAFWRDVRRHCFTTQQPLLSVATKLARRSVHRALGGRATADFPAKHMARIALLRDELITDRALARQTHWSKEAQSVPLAKHTLFNGLARYSTLRFLQSPSDFPAVRYTYPFVHRPLVELVLSLPASEQWRPGEPRALMKSAFADFVPRVVLDRRAKGYYVPAGVRTRRLATATWSSRLKDLEIVRRGFVDPHKMSGALASIASGLRTHYWPLDMAIHLEMWLNTWSGGDALRSTSALLASGAHLSQTHLRVGTT